MSTHFTLKRFFPLVLAGALLAGCVLPGTSRTGVNTPAASEPGSTTPQPAPVVNDENPEPTATEKSAQSSEAFTPLSMTAADCSYGGEFRSIEALDNRTVRFELCYPDVAFLSKIAFPSFGIIPTEYLEQTGGGGRESQLLTAPIGSGPYEVEDWKPGEELSFTAFSGYWGNSASIERLVFRWNLDDSQRLLELQTGTVEGIDEPNPQDLTAVQEDPNLVWVSRPPLSVSFLGMNNTYPPLDNQLVRQAISLALDRKMILDEYYPSGFQVAEFFTPCVIPNGCVGEPWYAYNPVMAREILAQAGYPDGFETQISYRSVVRGYMPEPAHVAEAIRTQLKQNLNISAKLSAIDSPRFLQAAEDGLLPGLFLMGWGADYPDASNFLDTHFGSLATKMLGNPFDDILLPLSQGRATAENEARRPFYETANNAIRQHLPLIPLAHGGWVQPQSLALAFHRAVEGSYADPFGFERFSEFSFPLKAELIWMQRYEPLSLYCADESDPASLRACVQVVETLYRFQAGSTLVEPALAERCEPNPELTTWTCTLRQDVKFHDGTFLDANDVVLSLLVQWDAALPLHKGRTGAFAYFKSFWGNFLNAPAR